MKNFFFLLGSLLVSEFAFAQCEADHTVEASSFQYAPEVLNIEVGETVAFVNLGGQHDVNGIASSIDGMSFNNPEEFYLGPVMGGAEGVCIGTVTFTMPGTYQYDCSIGTHAQLGMVGSIVVNEPANGTVVDIIVNSEDHTLLEAAVLAAGLDGALSAEGPYTVFAPTDAAIGALVTALGITAEDLLALPELGDILQYHVVAGLAMSTDLSDGQTISTLQGSDVTVTINADGVFINDAMVTVADIEADNGVVHVIDAVLLPSTENVVEAQLNFTVFPNPASDWIRVEGASSTATMVLRDAQGRLVTARETANNTMSIEGIPAGMYFVEIQDGVQRNVAPVIVR